MASGEGPRFLGCNVGAVGYCLHGYPVGDSGVSACPICWPSSIRPPVRPEVDDPRIAVLESDCRKKDAAIVRLAAEVDELRKRPRHETVDRLVTERNALWAEVAALRARLAVAEALAERWRRGADKGLAASTMAGRSERAQYRQQRQCADELAAALATPAGGGDGAPDA